MKKLILAVLLSVLSVPGWAQVTVPYIFVPNTVASSQQVNANFDALAQNALNRAGGKITGTITVDNGVTIDGVDISEILPNGGHTINTGTGSFISTTVPQLVVGYDPTHYTAMQVDQNGNVIYTLSQPNTGWHWNGTSVFKDVRITGGVECTACITATNLGPIPEAKILDETLLARNAGNEQITGAWAFFQALQLGVNSDASAHLVLAGNVSAKITFWYAGVNNGQIASVNNMLYLDQDFVTWRLTDGSANIGYLSSAGFWAAGALRSGTGFYQFPDGNLAIALNSNQYIQTFGTGIIFSNPANTFNMASIDSAGNVALNGELRIGNNGTIGQTIRIANLPGREGLFVGQAAGMPLTFQNMAGAQLAVLSGAGDWQTAKDVKPGAQLVLQDGSPTSPALTFANAPNSGIYFNRQVAPNGPTIDFGARFHLDGNRVVMRLAEDTIGQPRVNFMLGSVIPLQIEVDRVLVGAPTPQGTPNATTILFVNGPTVPARDNLFALGSPTGPYKLFWTHVYSTNGVITTSDEAQKDRKGPMSGALEALDTISPFVATWKKGFIKEEGYDETKDAFPTFSAQEVAAQLDAKYGTQIARQFPDGSWGMNYDRMTPVLWQAVKDLNTKVHTLETKVDAQYRALAALEMKLDAHKH